MAAHARSSTTPQAPPPAQDGGGYAAELLKTARAKAEAVLQEHGSQSNGLSKGEADARRKRFGPNEIAREKRLSAALLLLANIKNSLVLLLLARGALSFLTSDKRAIVVISAMLVPCVVLRCVQATRADNAAQQLRAMVRNTATVVSDGKNCAPA